MKKKVLTLGIITMLILILLILTGCGDNKTEINNEGESKNKIESSENEQEGIQNAKNTNNQNLESQLNNNSIEDAVKSFYTALYHQDSKTAYQYIDFVGVVAWAEKENGTPITDVERFEKKYQEILNNSSRIEEINNYFSNEEIYTKINKDVSYKDVTFDLKNEKKITDNIYSIEVGVRYSLAGTNTGTDKTLYLINKDGKYFFVSEDILWNKQILKGIVS